MVVGKVAPDFTTNALINGEVKNVSLNEYRGKWVVLFFYAGDFSFV